MTHRAAPEGRYQAPHPSLQRDPELYQAPPAQQSAPAQSYPPAPPTHPYTLPQPQLEVQQGHVPPASPPPGPAQGVQDPSAHGANQHPAAPAAPGAHNAEDRTHYARPPRKDHRLAVQAEKLRLAALTTAIQFGEQTPSIKPRRFGILLGSLAIGMVILGGTIGVSALLQWIANR